ncbi:DUF4262 domain-containing protein [uncultured Castellaniella sp.]|uniref:DUF4262 domain-containing protein n=1 Tax=uncultured Castellaniella sp. TaxID=647907 RepID=UPI00261973EA|nr:DUF4262 domain-containing protein [uncultured Castellaniella sp.]
MAQSEQDRNRSKLHGFLEDKLKWHDYTHLVVADDDMDPAAWFLHTIGLARSGQPELIVTGTLDHALAMDVISDLVAYGRQSGGLADGQRPGPAVRIPVLLRDVSTPFVLAQRVAQASSRFGASIRVLQVLWSDAAGRFPNDPAYDQATSPQQALWDMGA